MVAAGMTEDDRQEFRGLVETWTDTSPRYLALEFASDLAEAIELARANVGDSRRQRGRKLIKVRELARADKKLMALERRTRQREAIQTTGEAASSNKRGRGRAAIATLRQRRVE